MKKTQQPQPLELPSNVTIQVPAGFELSESTVVLRAADEPMRDPRLLVKQTTVRPNLLVKRTIGSSQTLTELAAELAQFLVNTMPGMITVDSGVFTFTDGVEGYRSTCEFTPMPKLKLKQIHVLRVDAGGAMHFTLTLGVDAKPDVIDRYLAGIAATKFTT